MLSTYLFNPGRILYFIVSLRDLSPEAMFSWSLPVASLN